MFTVLGESMKRKRRLVKNGVVCAIHELKELTDNHQFFLLILALYVM